MIRANMYDILDIQDLLAPGADLQRVRDALEKIKQRAVDEANAPPPFE